MLKEKEDTNRIENFLRNLESKIFDLEKRRGKKFSKKIKERMYVIAFRRENPLNREAPYRPKNDTLAK